MCFLVTRVQMYLVLTKFTPGFTIKSFVTDNFTVEIVGLNLKGLEIFKYVLLTDDQWIAHRNEESLINSATSKASKRSDGEVT